MAGDPDREAAERTLLSDVGHVRIDIGAGTLTHLVSGEQRCLPQDFFELRFDEAGAGVLLWGAGEQVGLSTFFEQEVVLDGGTAYLRHRSTGNRAEVDASKQTPTPAYLDMNIHSVVRLLIWRFVGFVAGAALWWDLPSISPVLNPGAGKHRNYFINKHWPRWAKAMQPHLPQHLGLRRALDRSGRVVAWTRCLREPSVSTAGLLVILSYRPIHGLLQDGSRQAAREAFGLFLQRTLGDEDFEMSIDMDRDANFYFGKLSQGASVATVLVQCLHVWLAPMVDATPEEFQGEVVALFGDLCEREGVPLETLPLISLLTAPEMQASCSWLYGRLISEIAVAIESFINWPALSQNPVDGIGAFHGSRWDQQLVDRVILGGGASSSSSIAAFPGQHARSFLSLAADRLKGRASMDVHKSQGGLLARYLHVGQAHFSQVTDIAIACDGSRVGGREILQLLFVARAPKGEWRCMWAPPQAYLGPGVHHLSQRVAARFHGASSGQGTFGAY